MLPVKLSDLLPVKTPEYSPGDIVYIAYRPNKTPSPSWPCIDSPYEIDCKITSIHTGKVSIYVLISGHGTVFEAKFSDLIHPKNKPFYTQRDTKIAIEDTELFPKGTPLTLVGEYYCNEEIGVYIHIDRLNTITNLFS